MKKAGFDKDTGNLMFFPKDTTTYPQFEISNVLVTEQQEIDYLKNQIAGKKFKIENNVIVEIIKTQAEIDAYNLLQLQTVAKSTLKTERKKAQYENVTYKGKTYYATPTAQLNLFQAYFLAKELTETSLNWLDINNKQVSLTLIDALALIKLLRDKINGLYINEAIAQNIVTNATTTAQIQAVLSAGSYTATPPTTIEGSEGLFSGGDIAPANGTEQV